MSRWALRDLRPRQLLSLPVWLAAFALLIIGDVLPAFMSLGTGPSRIGGLLTLLGVVALVLASRLSASSATQARALRPGERPVLYLRSFKADSNPVSTAADEETLSRIFRTVGPFVALEQPGELLPMLGSAKMSAGNDEWQQLVLDQMAEAELIVLNVGAPPSSLDMKRVLEPNVGLTQSLLWEVSRVLELAEPGKILVYFSVHASPEELQAMYALFVETASEIIPHPFPPVEEIGTRRFIRFDDERRPQLFGEIATPSTGWRTGVAILSLGIGLIPMRPFVAERLRSRMSAALEPIRFRFDRVGSSRPLFGRLTMAVGTYFGGLVALLPILAWNCWHVRRRRPALGALAPLPLVALGQVNETLGFFSLAFAIAAYLGWPLITPPEARRHIAFGGKTVNIAIAIAVVAIAAAGWSAGFLPRGFPQQIGREERSAVVDVEAVRSILPPELAYAGEAPSLVKTTKSALLDGSFGVAYQYQSANLVMVSKLTAFSSQMMREITDEFQADFPGFRAVPTSNAMHGDWRVQTYKVSFEGKEAGVGVTARRENMTHILLIISGFPLPADALTRIVAPRLDAAANVHGFDWNVR